jgi:AcrR family transcriptional regulator
LNNVTIATVPRLSRQQQAEANQKRLLDAALEVFTARGFHGSTLEQIAAAAGFTTGVVYSRFASKADLFLALLERTIDQRIGDLQRLTRSKAGEVGAAFNRSWWHEVRKRPAWMLVVIEFRVHAARDPQLNARYAALHSRHVEAIANAIAHDRGRAGQSPPEPLVDGALMVLALGSGLVLERWALGDEALGDLPERAGSTLERGMVSPGRARARPRARRK